MASSKSIVEIEIKDEAFKKFKAAFDDYNKALGKQPEAWRTTDKHIVNVNKDLDKTKKLSKDIETAFDGVERVTRSIAKNLLDATGALIKVAGRGGLAGGLIGAGSLWGISNLASGAGNTRFNSMGLGISAGAYNAANVNYSSIFSNPASTLGAIRGAQTSPEMQRMFSYAGINPNGKTSDELAGPLALSAQRMAKNTPDVNLGQMAQSTGYGEIFSLEDLTRFKQMTEDELKSTFQKTEQDKQILAMQDATLKSWQDLDKQFSRSGTQIEKVFVEGLVKLAPNIGKLSDSFAVAIDKIMKADQIPGVIDKLSSGIGGLADYLKNDAQKDFRGLMDTVDVVGGTLYGFARMLRSLFSFGSEKSLKASEYRDIESSFGELSPQIERYLENPTAHKGIPQGIELNSQIWGAVQSNPSLRDKFVKYGFQVPDSDPSLMGNAKSFLNEQSKDFKEYFNKNVHMDFQNISDSDTLKVIKDALSGFSGLPSIGSTMKIENATGGEVNTTVNGAVAQ